MGRSDFLDVNRLPATNRASAAGVQGRMNSSVESTPFPSQSNDRKSASASFRLIGRALPASPERVRMATNSSSEMTPSPLTSKAENAAASSAAAIIQYTSWWCVSCVCRSSPLQPTRGKVAAAFSREAQTPRGPSQELTFGQSRSYGSRGSSPAVQGWMGIAGEGRSRGFGHWGGAGEREDGVGRVGSGRFEWRAIPLAGWLSGFEPSHIGCRGVPRGGWVGGKPSLLIARRCYATLWVVVAALQEWCSWEDVPAFRSPPARRETHDTRHGTRNFTTKLPRTTVGTGGLQPALFAGRQDSRRISISDSIRPSLTVLHLPTYLPWPRRE